MLNGSFFALSLFGEQTWCSGEVVGDIGWELPNESTVTFYTAGKEAVKIVHRRAYSLGLVGDVTVDGNLEALVDLSRYGERERLSV